MAKKKEEITMSVSVEIVGKGGVLALVTIELEGSRRRVIEGGPFEVRRGRDGRLELTVNLDHPMAGLLAERKSDVWRAIRKACPDL